MLLRLQLAILMTASLLSPATLWGQTSLSSMLEVVLLPTYEHKSLQGIDSIVGQIDKKSGPSIFYEIGGVIPPGQPRFGGSFSNSAAAVPAASVAWTKSLRSKEKSTTVTYTKDQKLLISVEFAKEGANLTATAKTAEEIAEVMMIALSLREKAAK